MPCDEATRAETDRDDIQEMRRLFWLKFDGHITQEELERETARICDKQLSLTEREREEECKLA